jgi:hypothetical protein
MSNDTARNSGDKAISPIKEKNMSKRRFIQRLNFPTTSVTDSITIFTSS